MIQDSIQVLQARGYKVTNPRKQVLKVLDQAQKSLSPYDIQRLLDEQGKYLNHVTVYRILDLFCRLNLAHKVLSGGGFVKCVLGEKEGCLSFDGCCVNCRAMPPSLGTTQISPRQTNASVNPSGESAGSKPSRISSLACPRTTPTNWQNHRRTIAPKAFINNSLLLFIFFTQSPTII